MISIKDIVKKDFSILSAADSVDSAIDLMEKRKVDYLLVKEKNKIKGIITLQGLAGYPSSRLLIDCPIEPMVFVNEKTLLDKALKMLEKEKTSFLVILDNKKPAGIVKREIVISSLCKELKSLDRLKDIFTATAAHELKTPIVPIKGFLSMIGKNPGKYGLNEKAQEYVNICLENTKRLEVLINDVLDISKLEAGEMKFEMADVDLNRLIKNIVTNFLPLIEEKKLALNINISEKLLLVYGDPYRISQALNNLIDNAIKFTDKGSITINAKFIGKDIQIDVIDMGIGIKKENIPRLFKKFSQIGASTTRKEKGTGLGLVICKRIIEAHHGKIWAKSEGLEKGSTFSFSLPIKK